MNPFSGLLGVGLDLKIIQQSGAWYNIAGDEKKWYSKDISEYADVILEKAGDILAEKLIRLKIENAHIIKMKLQEAVKRKPTNEC